MTEQSGAVVGIRRATRDDLAVAPGLMQQVLTEGHGHQWDGDSEDLARVYLDHPRNALFVAVDERGAVCGTAAVREGSSDASRPGWLAERYADPATAELVGLYVPRPYRGQGIASRLVEPARQFAAGQGDYGRIYLHAHAVGPGAVEFWEATPATALYDARNEGDPLGTVHFELPISEPVDQAARSVYGVSVARPRAS